MTSRKEKKMFIAQILKAIRRFFEQQYALEELSSMSDRSLRDIGIERHEIARVVRQGR